MLRLLPNNEFEFVSEEKLTQLSSNEEVVVIAADWDGCFDVLFDETLEIKELAFAKAKLLQFREKSHYFFDQITQGKIVILVIVSNRQSHPFDVIAHQGGIIQGDPFIGLKNGLCLEKLPQLCKQKQWECCVYLLADTEHEKPAGTAYNDKTLNYSSYTGDKYVIALNHLCYFEQKYPHAKRIDYYFFDDLYDEILSRLERHFTKPLLNFDDIDPSILPKLKKRFQNGKIMRERKVPDNMHIHLVMSSWVKEIYSNTPAQIIGHIHKGKNLLQNVIILDTPPIKQQPIVPAAQTVLVYTPAPIATSNLPNTTSRYQPMLVPTTASTSNWNVFFGDLFKSITQCSCCFWNRRKNNKPTKDMTLNNNPSNSPKP